jgi:translation initiation factor 1
MSGQDKVPTDGGLSLGQNPFAGLRGEGLPAAPYSAKSISPSQGVAARQELASGTAPGRNRGRVDILRETAGRGGKTVTVAANFVGIGLPEKERLAKKMRAACGAGGTVKDGRIEIQGDHRESVAEILTEAGFRPVFAGG